MFGSFTIKFIYLFFLKLGIQPRNLLIQGVQSHRPFVGLHLKPEHSSDLATEIGTKGNRTRDLERSTIQSLEPTQIGQPNRVR